MEFDPQSTEDALLWAQERLRKLPRKVRLAMLFGMYAPLLNDNRRSVLSMWIDEDYSLSEIAEVLSISRQGVSDSIRHSESLLEETESKLGIVRRMMVQDALLNVCEGGSEEMRELSAYLHRLWE